MDHWSNIAKLIFLCILGDLFTDGMVMPTTDVLYTVKLSSFFAVLGI